MLAKVVQEGRDRRNTSIGGTALVGNFLGPCIRRLTASSHPEWVARIHDIGRPELIALDDTARERRLCEATEAYYNPYLKVVEWAISTGSMPNLELLNWEDKVVLPKSMFQAIVQSKVQHLRLFRVHIDEEFEVETSQDLPWPLKTLDLELDWEIGSEEAKQKGSTGPLILSLLRSCAPTLEVLRWIGPGLSSMDKISFLHNWKGVNFPCLRRLTLSFIPYADTSVLDTLLGSDTAVRELDLGFGCNAIGKTFFSERGNVRSLETLVCDSAYHNELLRANPQLLKLMMSSALPTTLIEGQILPILTRSFHNLSSLSLIWKEPSIPAQALEQISALGTLQQLQLSAGQQFGWKHDWLINLGEMRRPRFKKQSIYVVKLVVEILDGFVLLP